MTKEGEEICQKMEKNKKRRKWKSEYLDKQTLNLNLLDRIKQNKHSMLETKTIKKQINEIHRSQYERSSKPEQI